MQRATNRMNKTPEQHQWSWVRMKPVCRSSNLTYENGEGNLRRKLQRKTRVPKWQSSDKMRELSESGNRSGPRWA